ncbi:MAG: hypothetical protein ACI8QS_001490 [Planctomycetota bacterium]|jgi:hypothetical protein
MITLVLPLVGLLVLPAPSLLPQTGQDSKSGLRTAAELEAEGWTLVDAVVSQAGDGVITRGDLDRFLGQRLGPNVTQEQVQEMVPRALETLETIELETQAGEDMGIPEAELERNVQGQMDERRRTEGVSATLDYLDSRGLDAHNALTTQVRELKSILWRRDKLGLPGAAGRRVSRDKFLRPGTLRSFYRENRDALGDPPTVRFQRIAIACDELTPEGVELARLESLDLIARMAEGETFDDLLLTEGDEDPVNSLEEWQTIPDLSRLDPDLAEFGSRAPERSIFPQPLGAFPAAESPGAQPQQIGWFIYRLNDRVAGTPPPFESRLTQRKLRELLGSRWESAVLAQARDELAGGSYAWRHWFFGGAPALETAGPPVPGR